MRAVMLFLTLTAATPAFAQVQSRPTDSQATTPAAAPAAAVREVVGTSGVLAVERPQPRTTFSTLRHPQTNDGVWVSFLGEKWVSAGAAVPLSETAFVHVGEYGTFPVFARSGLHEDMIYIPTRAGLVAPYRLKE